MKYHFSEKERTEVVKQMQEDLFLEFIIGVTYTKLDAAASDRLPRDPASPRAMLRYNRPGIIWRSLAESRESPRSLSRVGRSLRRPEVVIDVRLDSSDIRRTFHERGH